MEGARGRRNRYCRGAAHTGRRPFRFGDGKKTHSGIPGGAQAQSGRPRADPVLCRPAGRGQDLARPKYCQGARAQVRARVAGRSARRGRDPRPPPHLYRRASGQHHPGAQKSRYARLRDDARRDRQGRHRHARRPLGGAARSPRPGAEQQLPRQLPRGALRSVARAVHHHRQCARYGPRAAARPDGDRAPSGLHAGGETRDCAPLSRSAPAHR